MQCNACLAVTSNRLAKKCPRKGCNGKLVKQKDSRSFSVVRAHGNPRKS